MPAQPLRELCPMESTAGYTSRNTLINEWQAQLLRVHNKRKLIFDDTGSFDVRLVRIGKLVYS
jgi:hypothetical protein